MDVFIQFALAASQFAVDDAKLEVTPEIADQVGVFIASGIGGFSTIEREHKELLNGGPRRISPFFIPASIINLAAGQVSIRFGARGPNLATCTACTASAHADRRGVRDHQARRRRRDDCRRIRGVDHADGRRRVRRRCARCRRATTSRSAPAGRSTRIATASSSARAPASSFSRNSSSRSARGAHDLRGDRRLRPVGRRVSPDRRSPRTPTAPCGRCGWRCARPASSRDQVDYINAHGTSTPINDPTETLAVKTTLRRARLQAGDVVDQVDDRASARRGRRPRGGHHGAGRSGTRSRRRPSTSTQPDPACDLDYAPNVKRPMKIDYALSNSFGFGGTNGTLLLKKYE